MYGEHHLRHLSEDVLDAVTRRLTPFGPALRRFGGPNVDRLTAHFNEWAETMSREALALHFYYMAARPELYEGLFTVRDSNGKKLGAVIAELVRKAAHVPALMLAVRMRMVIEAAGGGE